MQINLNSSFFKKTIEKLTKDFSIEEIIETGTFDGRGSTTIFAQTGIKTISIESCLNHYLLAKEHLKNYSNVTLIHGSSLKISEMEEFILKDTIYQSKEVLSRKISVDADNFKAQNFYLQEIKGFTNDPPKDQDLLFDLIDNKKSQLVFLDSAGGVGFLEFQKFLTLEPSKLKTKVLVLDDVLHVKHYRSVVLLKQKNYPVKISEDQRFAYCNFN